MESAIALIIVFLIIAVILGFLAAKKVFRIVNTIFTILALALMLASLALYLDALKIQERMKSDKLFVFENKELKAAFVYRDLPTPVLLSDLTEEREAYAADDLERVLRGKGILFIATPETFLGINHVTIETVKFEKLFILGLLDQADARQAYASKVRELANIPIGQEIQLPDVSAEEFRGFLFSALINEYLSRKTLTDAIRSGELRVYPSGLMFWSVRNLPGWMLDILVSQEAG